MPTTAGNSRRCNATIHLARFSCTLSRGVWYIHIYVYIHARGERRWRTRRASLSRPCRESLGQSSRDVNFVPTRRSSFTPGRLKKARGGESERERVREREREREKGARWMKLFRRATIWASLLRFRDGSWNIRVRNCRRNGFCFKVSTNGLDGLLKKFTWIIFYLFLKVFCPQLCIFLI